MRSTRRQFLLTGATAVAVVAAPRAFAAQQDNVDSLIARIGRTLDESLSAQKFQPKYNLAAMNIEDLRKTLLYGGVVSSNPVAAFGDKLEGLLNERREMLAYLVSMQNKIQKLRKGEAKGTINDIGAAMLRHLLKKPSVLRALGSAADTRSAQVIRDDFARLKSYDDWLKKIYDYINNLRPAINDIVARVNALSPLLKAYGSLASGGFEGTYIGQFTGGGQGRIRFIVKGTSVTGSISGSCLADPCGVDPMVGTFSGTIDKEGRITTNLTGTLTDSSGKLGSFGFTGSINGTVNGNTASGDWNGKNAWGAPHGSWTATR